MFALRPLLQMMLVSSFAIGLLLVMFWKRLSRKGHAWAKFLLIMMAVYYACLFYILLRPTYFTHRFMFTTERLNLRPLRVLAEWRTNPVSMIGSIVLFMPLGYFATLLHPERSDGKQLARCFFGAVVLSLVVEATQLWTFRVPDIDDILLNAIGSLLGGMVCLGLKHLHFDETIAGNVLLPKIPASWRGKIRFQHYCFILLMSMSVWLFSLNYVLTIPKTDRHTLNNQAIALEAKHVVVYDATHDEILYCQQAETAIYPASTQKLLVALTAADYVDFDEKVTLGNEIYMAPLDASKAGLAPGMTLQVKALMEALLLPSGADAAYSLAVLTGRRIAQDEHMSEEDALKTFIEAGNRKARSIGASRTFMKNVTGYDAQGQTTTAEDMLTIARAFLKNKQLASICRKADDQLSVGKHQTLYISNTNKMLHKASSYYNKAVAGVKTGTTSKAGCCLISVFTIKNQRYICVVMHSSYDGKFRDTQAIYKCLQ